MRPLRIAVAWCLAAFLMHLRLLQYNPCSLVGKVLQGGAAAARLWADGPDLDLLGGLAYVPPRKSMPDVKYRKTSTAIFEWAQELLDLYDQLGLSRDLAGTLVHTDDGRRVGRCSPGLEHAVARSLRELMDLNDLAAILTFMDFPATYYGNDGHCSKIDHCLPPAEAAKFVCTGKVLWSFNKVTQLVHLKKVVDHVPALCEINVQLAHQAAKIQARKKSTSIR